MQKVLNWLKSNFAYAFILFVLLVMAICSVSYAFLRGNSQTSSVVAAPVVDVDLNHLPLAEAITTGQTGDSGQPARNGATLGAEIKCKDNEAALTAVNLKIEAELNRHQEAVKHIGLGGLVKRLVGSSSENQQHQTAMEALQAEYAELLAQTNC